VNYKDILFCVAVGTIACLSVLIVVCFIPLILTWNFSKDIDRTGGFTMGALVLNEHLPVVVVSSAQRIWAWLVILLSLVLITGIIGLYRVSPDGSSTPWLRQMQRDNLKDKE
jgi:hypothetical protein